MSRRALHLWIVLLPVFVAAPLRTQQPVELPLRIRDTVPLPAEINGVLHPVKCDSRGSLLLRTGSSMNPLADPVRKISSDGKVTAVYSLQGSSGIDPVAGFDDFAVDPRGNVYLLAYKRMGKTEETTRDVILAFDSEGKYRSTITLDVLLNVGQLAVFSSGEFFVGGERIEAVDGELQRTGRPFVGIFDSDGRLVTEIALPQDVKGEARESSKESSTVPSGEAKAAPASSEESHSSEPAWNPDEQEPPLSRKDFLRALSLGSALAADDGNIYLMRATSNPTIYAIAPNGTVVRQFEVPAPSEHSNPVSFQVAAGKVVVMFSLADAPRKFKGHLFTILNPHSGEVLARYTDPPDGYVSLACYTPNGFTLIGVKDKQFVLRRTGPY